MVFELCGQTDRQTDIGLFITILFTPGFLSGYIPRNMEDMIIHYVLNVIFKT